MFWKKGRPGSRVRHGRIESRAPTGLQAISFTASPDEFERLGLCC
jgi:hypothetical protein